MFAFMAQTNYQLINIIKFVKFDNEGSFGNADLYIRKKLYESLVEPQMLIEKGLFKNIIVYDKVLSDKKNSINKIRSIVLLVSKKSFEKFLYERKRQSYETIVVPTVSIESQLFWNYYGHQKVYLIEDGLGSVTGNIIEDGMKRGRRAFTKYRYGEFKLDKMYVNCPLVSNSRINTEICKIEGIVDKSFFELLDKLFCTKAMDKFGEYNTFIYLQQPVKIWGTEYERQEKKLIEVIHKKSHGNMVLRKHPMLEQCTSLKGITTDDGKDVWEVVCTNKVSDKNVIIGIFSTAQFSLKQLYNIEPYIIFLYKIITPPTISIEIADEMIELFKKIYTNPNKIYVPKTKKELETLICELNREEKENS